MLTEKEVEKHTRDYADLGLGIQIRDCLIENDYCNFEAGH